MSGGQVHRAGTAALSLAMVAIGVALAVEAIVASGGATRLLLGALFVAAGCGRLYIERRRSLERRRGHGA